MVSINTKKNKYKFVNGFVDSHKTIYGQMRVKLLCPAGFVSVSLPRIIAHYAYPEITGRVAVMFKDEDRHNMHPENLSLVKSEDFAKMRKRKEITTCEIGGAKYIHTKFPDVVIDPRNYRLVVLSRNRPTTHTEDKDGYLFINHKQKTIYVHKLVFETFYEVLEGKDFVIDHIDHNNQNNHFENLQQAPRGINSSFFTI